MSKHTPNAQQAAAIAKLREALAACEQADVCVAFVTEDDESRVWQVWTPDESHDSQLAVANDGRQFFVLGDNGYVASDDVAYDEDDEL